MVRDRGNSKRRTAVVAAATLMAGTALVFSGPPAGAATAYQVSSTSGCTVADHGGSTGTVSLTSVGSCVIDAEQAGSPTAMQRLEVSKGLQTITFDPSDPGAHRVGTTDVVHATGGGSGRPVRFRVGAQSRQDGTCTVSDNEDGSALVELTAPGQCVVEARQAGSKNYRAARVARQSITSYQASSVDVGGTVYDIAVDPGLHRAYFLGKRSLTQVDTDTDMVVGRRIAISGDPSDVAVDTTSHRLYVVLQATRQVAVIDPVTRAVLRRVAVGFGPSDVAVDVATHQAFVTNRSDGTVSVIDTTTDAVQSDTITGFGQVESVAVDPVRHRAYVVNSDSGSGFVLKIDTLSDTIVGGAVFIGSFPGEVAVDTALHKAFITAYPNIVSVVDETTNNTDNRRHDVSVGSSPSGIAVDSGLHRGYVINSSDGTVSVISTRRESVVGDPIPVAGAGGIAADPQTHRVYVSSYPGGTVTVLRTVPGS